MRVTLVGKTEFFAPEHIAYEFEGSTGEDLSVLSGRLCYMSFHKPNKATATNEGYLKNIIAQEHFSVLEHSSASFLIEGVSRSLTHELCRHRHLSFSQLSQRYVNESDAHMVTPPAIKEHSRDNGDSPDSFITDVGEAWDDIDSGRVLDFRGAYQRLVKSLTDEGLPRKQAREAARAVLPNATETKIVVTGNMRAWRDVLKKRWHVAADAEIRQLAGELLRQLREIAPNTFQDIPEEPYGSEGND